MYSRLNTLVNEINALGLNQVKDEEINRKILRSLRKPDYDIINTLLQKEDIIKFTPNQVINQIIAHEYSMGKIGRWTPLKDVFCCRPLKKYDFAKRHYNFMLICQGTL